MQKRAAQSAPFCTKPPVRWAYDLSCFDGPSLLLALPTAWGEVGRGSARPDLGIGSYVGGMRPTRKLSSKNAIRNAMWMILEVQD